ncbi:MAG: hypothetical protein PHW27_06500 [Melioribacteraceae bacterium]|nr:hypothetical protein [Melioribacteraceae bacterium]
MKKSIVILVFCFVFVTASAINGQSSKGSFAERIKFSGTWFLGFHQGKMDGEDFSSFFIRRGYFTVRNSFNDKFSLRFTTDITLDEEGDGEGDIEIRLKYGYINYKFGSLGFLNDLSAEFGIVHRPYITFAHDIYNYRVQGATILDRFDMTSSADFGISFFGLLGGKMDNQYIKSADDKHPGKFGSFGFGIYNGAGYHGIEKNKSKVFEGRISLRPLWNLLPGLQLTYLGIFGKGNTDAEPDYNANAFDFSYQSSLINLQGLYYNGKGKQSGTLLDENGNVAKRKGYSAFAELKIPGTKFAVFGRYDFVKNEFISYDVKNKLMIAGIGYTFLERNRVILNFEKLDSDELDEDNNFIEMVFDIRF